MLTDEPMPHSRWFPGARLNWAQHLLRHGADGDPALVCVSEGGGAARELTFGELRRSVALLAAWPRRRWARSGRAARRTSVHTLSGKKLEVPITKLLRGTPLYKAANIASVDDPDALRWYERFATDRFGTPA